MNITEQATAMVSTLSKALTDVMNMAPWMPEVELFNRATGTIYVRFVPKSAVPPLTYELHWTDSGLVSIEAGDSTTIKETNAMGLPNLIGVTRPHRAVQAFVEFGRLANLIRPRAESHRLKPDVSTRDLSSFLGTMPPMHAGKARKALTRSWRLGKHGLLPLHRHVESFIEAGWEPGLVDTGAYFRSPSGNTFDKLPQVAFKYAEFILPDYEAVRASLLQSKDAVFDSYIRQGASDPESVKPDEVYGILSMATSPNELERLSTYLGEGRLGMEATIREDKDIITGEKGWARLRIDDPQAAWEMASADLESTDWLRRQEKDRYSLSNPRGFWANLAAFKALEQTKVEMGSDADELYVWDILPDAGFIEGDEGRVYTVMPDGNIALNIDTASADKAQIAKTIMLVA